MELDIREIQKIIPQRFPFLMIDKVIELEPGKKAVAIKNVTVNEPFFRGHFPNEPIMPGVLIAEALAQTAIVMLQAGKDKKLLYFLGGLKLKFLKPVVPGDQLYLEARSLKIINNSGFVEVEAKVDNGTVAKGEISFGAKEVSG